MQKREPDSDFSFLKVSYDEPRYLNKAYMGFYTWPDEPIVYAPGSQQPSLDRSEEVMI